MDSRFVVPNDLESRWWYVKDSEKTYDDNERGWLGQEGVTFAMGLSYLIFCIVPTLAMLVSGYYLPSLIAFLSGTVLSALLVYIRYVYVKRVTGFTRQYVRKNYSRLSQHLNFGGRGYSDGDITAVKEVKKMAKTIVTKTEYRMIDPSLPEKTFMEVLNNVR